MKKRGKSRINIEKNCKNQKNVCTSINKETVENSFRSFKNATRFFRRMKLSGFNLTPIRN